MNSNILNIVLCVVAAIVVAYVIWRIVAKANVNKKPKKVEIKDIPMNLESLINAFGGISNITGCEAKGSKISVKVNDDNAVKVNTLKELGASGIIQSTGKVTVILGKYSQEISNYINENIQ